MQFIQAIKWMLEGHKIKCDEIPHSYLYIERNPSSSNFNELMIKDKGNTTCLARSWSQSTFDTGSIIGLCLNSRTLEIYNPQTENQLKITELRKKAEELLNQAKELELSITTPKGT